MRVVVVEFTGDLPCNFDMRDLVLAHRDHIALVEKDIGGLQNRVTEMAVNQRVHIQIADLLFERRVSFKPR